MKMQPNWTDKELFLWLTPEKSYYSYRLLQNINIQVHIQVYSSSQALQVLDLCNIDLHNEKY